MRFIIRRSGLRVSSNDTTVTTAKTITWIPIVAAEHGGEGCGEGADRGIERDERQRQQLEPEEDERDQDPDDRGHGLAWPSSAGLSAVVSWPTWKPPPSAATAPIVAIASDGMIISFIAWPSATRGRFWMYW